MNVNNLTPFPAVAWESADSKKKWHITSLIRVKYVLKKSAEKGKWQLRLTPKQGELFGGDVFYDDDVDKPIRYESDFVSYKPNTDIILNAKTYSPNGQTQKSWQCGIEIFSPQGKSLNRSRLNVCGQRHWHKKLAVGWIKSTMQAVDMVSLSYDHAYGGKIPNPKAEEDGQDPFLIYDEYNPVGTGVRHRKMESTSFPVHQVSWVNKRLQEKSYAAGFGFTHRSWLPRIRYAGTYDQAWLDTQHPFPPHDFDYFHHQAANPELVMKGYIPLKSQFELDYLLKGYPHASFHLPELYCFSEFTTKTGETERRVMNIDTIIIDIDSDDPEQWAVYVSYRYFAPILQPLDAITMKYLPSELLVEQQQKRGQ